MSDWDTLEGVGNKIRAKAKQTNFIETLRDMLSNASSMLSSDDGRKRLWERLKEEIGKNDVASTAVMGGLTGLAAGGLHGLLRTPHTLEDAYRGRLGRMADSAINAGLIGAVGGGGYQLAKNTLLQKDAMTKEAQPLTPEQLAKLDSSNKIKIPRKKMTHRLWQVIPDDSPLPDLKMPGAAVEKPTVKAPAVTAGDMNPENKIKVKRTQVAKTVPPPVPASLPEQAVVETVQKATPAARAAEVIEKATGAPKVAPKAAPKLSFVDKLKADGGKFLDTITDNAAWNRIGNRSAALGGGVGAFVGGLTNEGNRAAGAAGGGALGSVVGKVVPTVLSSKMFSKNPWSAGAMSALSLLAQAGAGWEGGRLGAKIDKATGNHLAGLTGKVKNKLGMV